MILDFLGKIAIRLGIMLVLLAGIVGFAVTSATSSFQNVAGRMEQFEQTWLPDLERRSSVLISTSSLQGSFGQLLEASDAASVERHRQAASAATTELGALIEGDTGTVADLTRSVDALAGARAAQIQASEQIAAAIAEFDLLLVGLEAIVAEVQDEAIFEMIIGGEATVDSVSASLDALLTGDIVNLTTVLEARAAANTLIGTSLALIGTRDPAVRSILTDLSTSADATVLSLLETMAESEVLTPMLAPLSTLRDGAGKAIDAAVSRDLSAEILAASGDFERAVATAIDEIEFGLFIAAEETQTGNEASIRELLEVQLPKISNAAALSDAVRTSIIAALGTAVAPDHNFLDLRQSEFAASVARSGSLAEGFGDDIAMALAPLHQAADASTGLAAQRAAMLDAELRASDIAGKTAIAIAAITSSASAALEAAVSGTATTSAEITGEAVAAGSQIGNLGRLAGAALVATLLLAILTVGRPVARIARATELLAAGNLDTVNSLTARHGEVGRMVKALKVFRNALIEQARLEEESRARMAAEVARADALNLVVDTLGRNLKELSGGNLDAMISVEFSAEFAELKTHFNMAIDSLAALLRNVSETGEAVSGSVGCISASIDELSKRTETAAATIEETSSALRELTTSVQSTAAGARTASGIGEKARATATKGVEIVRDSAEAMSAIKSASDKIGRVVNVIDDIAFQTNLLALNAGVEAARAGETGRGFAVVAAEVRELAVKCSGAADEIKSLIADSDRVIKRGVSASELAGDSLDLIVASVTDMADQITEIAEIAAAQANTIVEINAATSHLDDATQRNAALSEETSAETMTLAHKARDLSDQIASFRLPEEPWDAAAGLRRAS